MTIEETFHDQIRQNRSRLLFFLLLYIAVTVVTGYLVGLAFEPVFDGMSHLARRETGIYLPWQETLPLGPTPFLEGAVFKVMVAFLIGACLYCGYLWNHGAKAVLSLVNARPLKEQRLGNVVEEMAVAAGLDPAPKVWITEDPLPNAFACGDEKNGSAIVVTRGLLDELNRDELQAVVAHETAHLRNGDTRLMTLLFGVTRAVDLIQWLVFSILKLLAFTVRKSGEQAVQDGTITITRRVLPKRSSDYYFTLEGDEVVLRPVKSAPPEDRAHVYRPMADLRVRQIRRNVERMTVGLFVGVLFLALVCLVLVVALVAPLLYLPVMADRWDLMALALWVPLALLMVRRAVSRNREYQADMTAVALTRNPSALQSALVKLSDPTVSSSQMSPSVSHLCIVPLLGGLGGGDLADWAERKLYDDGGILDREANEAVWRWVRANVSPAKQLLARVYVPLATLRVLLVGLKPLAWVANLFVTHPPIEERILRLEAAGASSGLRRP